MGLENKKQWVVAELTYQGENEVPERLIQILQDSYGVDTDMFIPAQTFYRRNSYVTICLMEGYIFLEGGRPASFYLDLEGTRYISKILTKDDPLGRYLSYVSHGEIEAMRGKLLEQTRREFQEGDVVEVVEGVYEHLDGTVVALNQEAKTALVKIHDLLSIDTVVELPLQFLAKSGLGGEQA